MVREYRVLHTRRLRPGHVTLRARIRHSRSLRSRTLTGRLRMARKAPLPIVREPPGSRRHRVRIVASPAPELSVRSAGAHAHRQLLYVTHNGHRRTRRIPDEDVEARKEILPGCETGRRSQTSDLHHARKMTLRADAVATRMVEPCRIHDTSGRCFPRPHGCDMCRARSMTPLAGHT